MARITGGDHVGHQLGLHDLPLLPVSYTRSSQLMMAGLPNRKAGNQHRRNGHQTARSSTRADTAIEGGLNRPDVLHLRHDQDRASGLPSGGAGLCLRDILGPRPCAVYDPHLRLRLTPHQGDGQVT